MQGEESAIKHKVSLIFTCMLWKCALFCGILKLAIIIIATKFNATLTAITFP